MTRISDSERLSLAARPIESIAAYSQDIEFCGDVRNALMMLDEDDATIIGEMESDRILDLARVLIAIRALSREDLTQMLLEHSLCPLHTRDYAICFDDEDPECATIREIHPDHDT